ncbi:uncharacterized protein [Diadema setosum]|uniref:uncharacterized protein n=1 Tax=Diadema setosum TaxID=31175 RepID=UPI003B3B455D
MASCITSKYLQLPDCDTSNKPSPLALLVATCQRIGSASRPSSPAAQLQPPRERSPAVEHKASEKVAPARSPRPTLTRSTSPATTTAASTMLPAVSPSEVPSPSAPRSPSYQLPLTPPTTPPQTDTCEPTPSPLRQSPIQVIKHRESTPSELGLTEHSQHHFPYYPVLHAPGLGLSPYPVVVPSTSPLSPYQGACLRQCCPHISSVPPPVYYPHPLLALPPAPLPPPVLPFGVYHHHHDVVDQTACGKIRYHHSHHHQHRLHKTPYSRSTALKEREEDIIDVVTV